MSIHMDKKAPLYQGVINIPMGVKNTVVINPFQNLGAIQND